MADDATPAAKKAPATKAAAPKADKAAAPKAAAPKAAAAKAAAPKAAATKPAAEKATTAKAPAAAKAATAKAPAAKTPAKKAAPAAKKPPVEHVARPQVLKVHHLRPAAGSKKARTRVGRGEGSKGKTAGRGTKGTKARYQVRVGLEGGNLNSVMRAPKLRGFKNPFRVEYQVVNLDRLAELYPKGGDVTISDLVAKGAVRSNEKVKVLGNGDITVKLNVAVDKVSGSAEQKIVAAGGSIK
ncbi:MAG TPA: 50S ribosomal protein L15 [Galbitalea sp.]|jgi:large subunit ribosomal protein L15|nr:50S ribosomal protein L15 [Galbitalea sp.]